MDKPKFLVSYKTNEYPSGLKSAEEMSQAIGTLTPERIIELADSGYIPHYRIDNGEPLFKPVEVKRWVAENLIGQCIGRSLPEAIRIVVPAEDIYERPPISIGNIPNLQQIPRFGYQPGIYFLCKGSEVVYVGQSVSPSMRIGAHNVDVKKDFDRVYLLPVPESELNDVEAAFIHHLRPKLQGKVNGDKEILISPRMSRPQSEILMSVGVGNAI